VYEQLACKALDVLHNVGMHLISVWKFLEGGGVVVRHQLLSLLCNVDFGFIDETFNLSAVQNVERLDPRAKKALIVVEWKAVYLIM